MKVAVIGAGWAGCAAAWRLKTQGHQVSVFEASRHIGGRAPPPAASTAPIWGVIPIMASTSCWAPTPSFWV
ncbi:FAD-dependent oxidoreductase [Alcaligenes faecalis]|uniref:FAD-dependent oxidoreductase n=1 Tax=Alcaligenes faecalis TaxID=511 RepID=UPI003B27EDA7